MGHNEAALPPVRGADARSRNNERPDFVAETLQVSSAIFERHADEASNVFSKHPSGPELRHDPVHLRPEETVIVRASSLPGATERLAGKAAADEGRAFDAGPPKSVCCNVADVVESRYAGPVSGQDSSAVVVTFHLCYCLKAGRFRSQVDPADPREEADMGEAHGRCSPALTNGSIRTAIRSRLCQDLRIIIRRTAHPPPFGSRDADLAASRAAQIAA